MTKDDNDNLPAQCHPIIKQKKRKKLKETNHETM